MDNYEKKYNFDKANGESSNSAANGHCPNCKDKNKDKKDSTKKSYDSSNSYGGTPGHRGEQLYFPSLQNSEDAPYSDEAYQDEDTDNSNG